jgi:hypothetical protein
MEEVKRASEAIGNSTFDIEEAVSFVESGMVLNLEYPSFFPLFIKSLIQLTAA